MIFESGTASKWGLFGRIIALVIAVSFLLNLTWEYAQCATFFIHGALRATQRGMLVATGGDVVMTLSLYLGAAISGRSFTGIVEGCKPRTWALIEILGVAEGIGMEWMGLIMGRWSYAPQTPMIPWTGISIIPVLQIPLLTTLAFCVVRRLVRKGS